MMKKNTNHISGVGDYMKMRNFLIVMLFFPLLMSADYSSYAADAADAVRFVDIDSSSLELLSMQEMRFCYISFVRVDGKKLLVKQKKPLHKLLGVVRDAVTAHIIAENFDIAHKVDIIPADQKFPGKWRTDWPATIHTIAPGKTIKGQSSKYDKMNIKQADTGFRRDMIQWMVKHPTLVKVVALDTFLCNHDRHRGNLFYNQKTDSFCAIDMDSAFKYNLCALACKNFIKMMDKDLFPLKRDELRVLIEYRNILEMLIRKHHPEETIQIYNYYADKAGFVEGSPLYTKKMYGQLEANRAMIRQSYEDVKKLVKILNSIIKRVIKT